jgi:hypothetical protein
MNITVSTKNIKEIDILAFLLMRESRISTDTKSLMLSNNAKFYNIFKSENYDQNGLYTVVASSEHKPNRELLTISEFINK